MNWEAAAHDEAKRQDREDSDWYAREATWLFMDGARWQRERLRTDEAVERMARDLYVHSTVGATEKTWDLGSLIPKDAWRIKARAAITALLGEDA